jgi:hypothetical protein
MGRTHKTKAVGALEGTDSFWRASRGSDWAMAPEFLQLDTTHQSRINYRMTARDFSAQPTLILVMGIQGVRA